MEQESAYLDLTIISAADLKRTWLSGDRMVAVAWVDLSAKKTTSIVSGNGSNVQWDDKLILSLNGVDTLLESKLLTIEIHAHGTWGNSLLGSVYVPLVDLGVDGEQRGNTTLMYEIVQPSGKRQGSIKFFAKVVKPRVSFPLLSGSVVSMPSAPPIVPGEDHCNGLGSNALYPPASAMCPVETNDERLSSEASSLYPYPPQLHFSQHYAAAHDAWQCDTSPDLGSQPPHMYPPVNTTHLLHEPPAPCSPCSNYTGKIPYPPPSRPVSETPYPPPTSVYPPNYTGKIPYPPPSWSVSETPYPPPTSVYPPNYTGKIQYHPPSWPVSETPYPPPTSVYPPLGMFSEAPYPPIAPHSPYPPIGSHPSEMYSSASFYPYSNCSSPLYPPPYPHQHTAVHCPYAS